MEKLPFPEVVDSSFFHDFRACPRRAQLAHLEHWKPKGVSVHLHAGKAFADGLERTRRSYFEANNDSDTALAHGVRALIESYGDFQPPEFGSGAAKTLDRMIGALEFYFSDLGWPIDSTPPHVMPSGKRAIEFSFAEPLPFLHPVTGNPVIYAGRSDMICDFAQGVYIEDDKTATSLGDTWAKQWDLRSQFTGYCWAAGKSGIPVNGVLVRGVSILKTKYGRADAITYRSAWEIDRWTAQVFRDLTRLQEMWENGYFDYTLDNACNDFGGCQFREICKSQVPMDWLPVSFERRKWDPLERTETLLEEEPA